MGWSPQNIAEVFPPANLSIISSVQQIPLFKSESFLREKYEVEGLSIKEIADLIFSSRTPVANSLRAYGIPIRPNDVLNKTKSQLRFGEAWRKRKVVVHQREQDAIQKMKHLREQGFSYWKIAEVFNSMKVPTKTGRGRWHARSIQKIQTDNAEKSKTQKNAF